jgi:hypothetical protein
VPRPCAGRVERFDIVLIGSVVVLACATLPALVSPDHGARIVTPALDLVLASVALAVASSIGVHAWVRYRERREPFALFQGLRL